MARGQAALEFMLAFAATVAMAMLIAAALNAEREEAGRKGQDLEAVGRVEGALRAVEAATVAGGISLDFREEGVFCRVEGSRLRVDYGGKTIEAGGVFADDAAEPV